MGDNFTIDRPTYGKMNEMRIVSKLMSFYALKCKALIGNRTRTRTKRVRDIKPPVVGYIGS